MTEKVEAAPRVELSRRDQLLNDFLKGRRAIFQAIAGLTEEDLITKAIGGNSVKDILAHIVEWDESALKNTRKFLNGKRVDLSPDRDNDAFNAKAINTWVKESGFRLVTMFNLSTNAVFDQLQELSDSELFADRDIKFEDQVVNPAWFLVEAEHDLAHAREIEEWKQEAGISGI